ncbi:MAG: nucleoside triphosphate pyrophosphohydrolase family protein [bacterium]|nr:nucleoside triphosphate pyrophosphohydrolase family protein [bacterium]
MDFKEYQEKSVETVVDLGERDNLIHFTFGLAGEVGEVTEKIKKVHRDKGFEFDDDDKKYLEKELGDVLWYTSQLATALSLSLNEIAEKNTAKLQSRKTRGKLLGSGDDR